MLLTAAALLFFAVVAGCGGRSDYGDLALCGAGNCAAEADGPLRVEIRLPGPGARVGEGRALTVAGEVAGGRPPYALRWDLDGAPLAYRTTSPGTVVFPEAGLRTLGLTAFDSAGGYARVTVTVDVDDLAGGWRPYFGHLHNHYGLYDADAAAEALAWARDDAGMDFVALTDHSTHLMAEDWELWRQVAQAATEPGAFVVIRGFEWSHPSAGHLCVFDTADYTAATDPDDWSVFVTGWLIPQGGIAMFNHPGREPDVFDDFTWLPGDGDALVALETANRSWGNASNHYQPYYIQALDQGWHVAPTASLDNSGPSAVPHRTVFWAPALTTDGLLGALRARRVYSTDDPGLELAFRCGDAWMGDTVRLAAPGPVEFQARAADDEPIARLELVTAGGRVAAAVEPPSGARRFVWFPVVDVREDAWFFLRATLVDLQDDEAPFQVAVTAPIYVEVD